MIFTAEQIQFYQYRRRLCRRILILLAAYVTLLSLNVYAITPLQEAPADLSPAAQQLWNLFLSPTPKYWGAEDHFYNRNQETKRQFRDNLYTSIEAQAWRELSVHPKFKPYLLDGQHNAIEAIARVWTQAVQGPIGDFDFDFQFENRLLASFDQMIFRSRRALASPSYTEAARKHTTTLREDQKAALSNDPNARRTFARSINSIQESESWTTTKALSLLQFNDWKSGWLRKLKKTAALNFKEYVRAHIDRHGQGFWMPHLIFSGEGVHDEVDLKSLENKQVNFIFQSSASGIPSTYEFKNSNDQTFRLMQIIMNRTVDVIPGSFASWPPYAQMAQMSKDEGYALYLACKYLVEEAEQKIKVLIENLTTLQWSPDAKKLREEIVSLLRPWSSYDAIFFPKFRRSDCEISGSLIRMQMEGWNRQLSFGNESTFISDLQWFGMGQSADYWHQRDEQASKAGRPYLGPIFQKSSHEDPIASLHSVLNRDSNKIFERIIEQPFAFNIEQNQSLGAHPPEKERTIFKVSSLPLINQPRYFRVSNERLTKELVPYKLQPETFRKLKSIAVRSVTPISVQSGNLIIPTPLGYSLSGIRIKNSDGKKLKLNEDFSLFSFTDKSQFVAKLLSAGDLLSLTAFFEKNSADSHLFVPEHLFDLRLGWLHELVLDFESAGMFALQKSIENLIASKIRVITAFDLMRALSDSSLYTYYPTHKIDESQDKIKLSQFIALLNAHGVLCMQCKDAQSILQHLFQDHFSSVRELSFESASIFVNERGKLATPLHAILLARWHNQLTATFDATPFVVENRDQNLEEAWEQAEAQRLTKSKRPSDLVYADLLMRAYEELIKIATDLHFTPSVFDRNGLFEKTIDHLKQAILILKTTTATRDQIFAKLRVIRQESQSHLKNLVSLINYQTDDPNLMSLVAFYRASQTQLFYALQLLENFEMNRPDQNDDVTPKAATKCVEILEANNRFK